MNEIKLSAPMRALKWLSSKYPKVFEIFEHIRAENNGAKQMPHERVYIPVAASVEYMHFLQREQGNEDEAFSLTPSFQRNLTLLTAIPAWRAAKNIYNFAPELTEELYKQAKSDRIQLSPNLLQLPYWCIYIRPDTKEKFGNQRLDGFFAFFDYFDGQFELHFLPMRADGNPIVGTLYLLLKDDGTTIDEQIRHTVEGFQNEDFAESAAKNGEDAEKIKKEFTQGMTAHADLFARWINLILYLSASNAEVKPAFSTPFKRTKAIKDVPREVEVLNVGQETAARIITLRRTAATSPQSEPQGGTHRSPVMHIRRAHWHTFYTGSKSLPLSERKTVLHWLSPVIVNADDEEMLETIIQVKK